MSGIRVVVDKLALAVRSQPETEGENRKAFTYRLEHEDGTPVVPPTFRSSLEPRGTSATCSTLAVRRSALWTHAGLEHRSPYALRHTYATFAIAAGVSLFELARFMGTSVDQIDKTYGHLLPDALDRTRAALDRFARAHAVNARAKS